MKICLPIVATFSLLLFSSCSSVKQSIAKVKTLTSREPKLQLTKADPSKFLPEGTSVEKLASSSAAQKAVAKKAASKKESKPQATPEPVRLLAKNTKSPPKSRSIASPQPKAQPKVQTKAKPRPQPKLEPIPPLELPPLPERSADDGQGFNGILPSLDGSDIATYIDVDGETPELPPVEFIEVQSVEEATEASE